MPDASQTAAAAAVMAAEAPQAETTVRRRRSAFEADAAAVKPRQEFLTLWIDAEEYAVPIRRALEIVRCDSVTRVPRTPPWWRGVMNLRGAVIPVVDLAVRFARSETALTSRSCVVIIEVDWTGERVALKTVIDYLADHPEIELVRFVLFGAVDLEVYEAALKDLTK